MAWSSFLSWPLTPSSKFLTYNYLYYKEILQKSLREMALLQYPNPLPIWQTTVHNAANGTFHREKCGFYHPSDIPADKEYGRGSGTLNRGSCMVCNTHFQYRPNKTCNWNRKSTNRQTNVTTQTNTAVAQTVATSTANRAMPYSIWNGRCNRLTK